MMAGKSFFHEKTKIVELAEKSTLVQWDSKKGYKDENFKTGSYLRKSGEDHFIGVVFDHSTRNRMATFPEAHSHDFTS